METDSYTVRLKSLLDRVGVSQHVTEPTHVCGHILDLVLTDQVSDLLVSVYVDTFISDHAAVHCGLHGQKPIPLKSEITYRKLKSIVHADFATDIGESELLQNPSQNLSKLVEQYDACLSNTLNKHAPLKTRNIPLRPPAPWIQEEVFDAKRERRRLERHWRKTKLPNDRAAFQTQRRLVSDMIDVQKSKYFLAEITKCGKDQKALFRVVDTLLHRRNKLVLPEHDNIHDVLQMFGDFFSDKIRKIRTSLEASGDSPLELVCNAQPNQRPVPSMTKVNLATPDEIKKGHSRLPKQIVWS